MYSVVRTADSMAALLAERSALHLVALLAALLADRMAAWKAVQMAESRAAS